MSTLTDQMELLALRRVGEIKILLDASQEQVLVGNLETGATLNNYADRLTEDVTMLVRAGELLDAVLTYANTMPDTFAEEAQNLRTLIEGAE